MEDSLCLKDNYVFSKKVNKFIKIKSLKCEVVDNLIGDTVANWMNHGGWSKQSGWIKNW